MTVNVSVVVKTFECVLSTDLMDHVPDSVDAGKPAVGKYLPQ